MKAYCINLDNRPDRLAHAVAEFKRQNMPFERIVAVDGKNPKVTTLAQTIPPMWTGDRMSAGAYACLLSHRKAWVQLLESGERYAMVFEDDLLLADGIANYLHDDWIPENADVIKLETWGTRIHITRNVAAVVSGRSLHVLRSSHIGSGAYVLSAETAQKLLTETEICGDPIDEVIFNDKLAMFPSLAVYQMVPAPAIQGERTSTDRARTGGADWINSSLEDRMVFSSNSTRPEREYLSKRLWRRTREELRARLNGTVYVVVSHG